MRILIIEDEVDLRDALVLGLQEDGYVVDQAGDGEEGLFKALAWEYDAIVLDLMLPKLDGWQVLARLREKKRTPVMILTALDTVDDCVRGLDMGSDDFLVKPREIGELAARLRALTRRTSQLAQNHITCGPIEVDLASKEVSSSGEKVMLTALEYSLVEYLMTRCGRVVSRSELYEHLFDETADSLSNHLDVHVCNIRKKLGPDTIETRRGHGYVMGVGES